MTETASRESLRGKGSIEEAREFAIQAARIAFDNRATDVTVVDLRGLSSVADFFVLGTGTSDRQMHAVVDRIHDFARSVGRRPYKISDPASASWILTDYVDVVVHLFDREHRAFYDLDGLWGDAPRVEWQPLPTPPR
jgi:ribosome-associated protein